MQKKPPKNPAFTLMNIWAFLMRQTAIWRWNKSSSKLETLLASLLCKQYCADSSLQHSVTQSFDQAVVVFHLPFHLPVSCRHPHCSNSAHSFVVEEEAAPVGHCVCECRSSSELEGNSRWAGSSVFEGGYIHAECITFLSLWCISQIRNVQKQFVVVKAVSLSSECFSQLV